MTDNYKEQEVSNYGEEIAAREYERQREEGRNESVAWDVMQSQMNVIEEAMKKVHGEDIPW